MVEVDQLQNLDLFAEFTDLCIDDLEQDAESGDEREHDDMPEGEIGDAEEDAEEDVVMYTPAPKPLKPLQPPFGQHAGRHKWHKGSATGASQARSEAQCKSRREANGKARREAVPERFFRAEAGYKKARTGGSH